MMVEDVIRISLSEIERGDWVFRIDKTGKPNHIGYIVDNLQVIHAKGREEGVIIEPFIENEWDFAGRPQIFS